MFAIGTATGTVFRLKGKGMPVLNRSRVGDEYITVQVEVPKKLNKKQYFDSKMYYFEKHH